MRILIVDDESPARERLKRLLAGVESVELVGEAEDGPQAVELIEREQPDLVLLDIQHAGLVPPGRYSTPKPLPSSSGPTSRRKA